MLGLALRFHVCYATPMNTTDALIHLPNADVSPWRYSWGRYERYVSFTCDHGNRRYAILTVYGNVEGACIVTVKYADGVHEVLTGEYADPFSTANETLLALAGGCGCIEGNS